MYVCWSAKGGVGTTVVAASLALVLSRTRASLLVDLCGDAPAALGLPEPSGPGVSDWLASPDADADALRRLAVPATETLRLAPRGTRSVGHDAPWGRLADALLTGGDQVVVDAGMGAPPDELVRGAEHSLLVTRPCYLALRHAVGLDLRPTGIVVLHEPGRALQAIDIERALGAPVVAELPFDPAVARSVDAGLLASRLPRSVAQPLRAAV